MLLHIPAALHSYTHGARTVDVGGATLDESLHRLDQMYPGIRFRIVDEQDRIRRHIKLYVNEEITEDLSISLRNIDHVHIVCALSGG
jgi:molybdopterin synthase sulfur carrier subunit